MVQVILQDGWPHYWGDVTYPSRYEDWGFVPRYLDSSRNWAITSGHGSQGLFGEMIHRHLSVQLDIHCIEYPGAKVTLLSTVGTASFWFRKLFMEYKDFYIVMLASLEQINICHYTRQTIFLFL